jgi:lipoprotein-anchoring transpeptidase ErfK/SrfK
MARRRNHRSGHGGILWLGLLALLVVGWLGWRGGWWPVNVAPAETSIADSVSPLEQTQQDTQLDSLNNLPAQFEPPIVTDQIATAKVVAGSQSSFPTASVDQANNWKPTRSRSYASPARAPIGSPRIQPVESKLAIPNSSTGPKTVSEIDSLVQSGDLVAAHKALSWIYFQQPGQRDQITQRINQTAKALFFSPRPHILPAHTIQPGDSLAGIAPRYQVGWQYLAELNRVTPRRIRAGQTLKVIRGPFRVVVDLSEFSLLVRTDTEYVCTFPIGIGRDHSTPLGRFRVLRKVPDPQYTDPDGRVVPASVPENPLGRFWIDLGEGYGIHGTNQPDSIRRAESRGCLRLHNADIQQLYGMLVTGCEVVIHR